MEPSNTPLLPLPEDIAQAAVAAGLAVWNAGLEAITREAASDPYEESVDLEIDPNSRDDLAEEASSKPWGELSDAYLEDGNWDYLESQRREAFESLWSQAVATRGPARPLWVEIIGHMEERGDETGAGFDEDDFEKEARDAAWEVCREEGLDGLHEIVPRLTGSRRGMTDLNVSGSLRGAAHELEALVPDLKGAPHAWAQFLCALKIHPADFAQAVRERVAIAIDAADGLYNTPPAELRELKSELRESLREQGLSRAPSRAPASWSAGMAALANAWAAMGASLPRKEEAPLADVHWIMEIFGRVGPDPEVEIELGVQGADLMAHSELLERFGTSSPVCLEGASARSFAALSPSMFLEGEEVAINGTLALAVGDVSWQSDTSGDNNVEASQRAKREGACQAIELQWRLAPWRRDQEPAPEQAEPKALELARKLALADPRALACALDGAKARGAHPGAIEQAREACELSRSAIQARLAKSNKAAAPAPKRRPARLEDFDVREGVALSAPWRSELTPALAKRRDSLGNSLAHKAVVGGDPALLDFALAHDPSSALEANRCGKTPMDMALAAANLFGLDSDYGFGALVESFARRRVPGAEPQAWGGLKLMERALNVGSAKAACALLEAGCPLDALDGAGDPMWRRCSLLKARQFIPAVRKAVELGWDLNQPNAEGRTLGGLARDPEAVLELAKLGASFADGHSIDPQAFAKIEAQLLAKPNPQAAPAPARARL
jgi:hypothetical protein